MPSTNIIFLKPHFEQKIWGGNHLKKYHYDLPSTKTGEAWVISGIDKKSSYLADGTPFSDFFKNNRKLFDNYETDQYPLLAKILDCNDALSVQVHPTKSYCSKHPLADEKNEAWYILDCQPKSRIVYGHNAKNKPELEKMIKGGMWTKLLKYVNVKQGQVYFVPSGTIHALGKGLLIYEIQQSSDTTYRVYDYDRNKDDQKRKLHIEESLANITVPFKAPISNHNKETLISTKFFNLVTAFKPKKYIFNNARWLQCSVIEGTGMVDDAKIKKGDNFVIINGVKQFTLKGNAKLLVSFITK